MWSECHGLLELEQCNELMLYSLTGRPRASYKKKTIMTFLRIWVGANKILQARASFLPISWLMLTFIEEAEAVRKRGEVMKIVLHQDMGVTGIFCFSSVPDAHIGSPASEAL